MKNRFLTIHGRILATCGSLACLCLGSSSIQARGGPINLDIIKRDSYGSVQLRHSGPNELVVEGTLNGHAVRLILDTGAATDNIVLTNSFATFLRAPPQPVKEYGVSISGKHIEHLRRGKVDSLVLGTVQVANTTVDFGSFEHLARRNLEGVFLLPSLNEKRTNRTDADGFLGLGFLQRCAAIIDPGDNRLYLKPPGVGRVPQLGPALKSVGFSEASFQLSTAGFLVDVSLNDVSTKMVIDTGADISVVDSRFASQAKRKSYGATGIRMRDSAGAESTISWIDPTSFKVGGVEALRTKLAAQATSLYQPSGGKIGGLLGMDFIGQSWGIIDLAQRKFYFVATR
jgi:Aspartyl protease